MSRYKVTLSIGTVADSPREAKAKVKAMLTSGTYKGKYLFFAPSVFFKEAKVEKLSF